MCIIVEWKKITGIGLIELPDLELDWVWVWMINAGACLVCYFVARTAAKVHTQFVCYALPLTLASPVILGFLLGMCEQWSGNPCGFNGKLLWNRNPDF